MDTPSERAPLSGEKDNQQPLTWDLQQFLTLQGIQVSAAEARGVAKTLQRLMPPSVRQETSR